MTWPGILENIVADALFVLLAIVLAWAWATFTQRRRLLEFFDAARLRRLPIYLSNIYVEQFGSVGIDGTRLSYQGEVVAHGEVQGASHLRNLFSFLIPRLADVSDYVGNVLLSDVQVPILLSPRGEDALETAAPFIALGTPAFNLAAVYVEKWGGTYVRFRPGAVRMQAGSENQAVEGSPDASTRGESLVSNPEAEDTERNGEAEADDSALTLSPETEHTASETEPAEPAAILADDIAPITDTTCGFVQRTRDTQAGRSLFYVAGLSEFSTRAAAYYLSAKWRALHKKYGAERPFLVILKFERHDFKRWSVVLEMTSPE